MLYLSDFERRNLVKFMLLRGGCCPVCISERVSVSELAPGVFV